MWTAERWPERRQAERHVAATPRRRSRPGRRRRPARTSASRCAPDQHLFAPPDHRLDLEPLDPRLGCPARRLPAHHGSHRRAEGRGVLEVGRDPADVGLVGDVRGGDFQHDRIPDLARRAQSRPRRGRTAGPGRTRCRTPPEQRAAYSGSTNRPLRRAPRSSDGPPPRSTRNAFGAGPWACPPRPVAGERGQARTASSGNVNVGTPAASSGPTSRLDPSDRTGRLRPVSGSRPRPVEDRGAAASLA